jgi:hypothetical protein
MATYEAVLTVPQSVDETLAFVSDLRNAARWDPRTYGVEKVTDGPIGVGTRFMLTGGGFRMDRQNPSVPCRCVRVQTRWVGFAW